MSAWSFRESCPWCADVFYSEGAFLAHVAAEGAIDKGPLPVVSMGTVKAVLPLPQLTLFKDKTGFTKPSDPHATQEVFD